MVKYYRKNKSSFFFIKCYTFSDFQRILKFKNSPRNCCLFAPSGSSYNQYVKSFTLLYYNQYVNTHQDLQHFQNFLYRHFYKTEYYDKLRPISNQPVLFFATGKTHKFNQTEDINIQDLKLRIIIDQTGTYIYNASKVIANYLKPLAKNDFTLVKRCLFLIC